MSSPHISLCCCLILPFYEVFLPPVKGKDADNDTDFLAFSSQQMVFLYISTGHFALH